VSDEQQIRDEILARIAELDERADELRRRRSATSIEIAELDREVARLRYRLRHLEQDKSGEA
jgi:septal ring factor EnvC (AmiA/AmiB activator)